MTNSRSWILVLWFLALVAAGLAPSSLTLAESGEAPAVINNPNPGADLWRAVRGHLESPAVTQVTGFDTAVLVNEQGSRWTSIRVNELVPKSPGVANLRYPVAWAPVHGCRPGEASAGRVRSRGAAP